jgi:hypothetical protein
MMYYSNDDSYPRMDFASGEGQVAGCLKTVQEAGWPSSRTILSYQVFYILSVLTLSCEPHNLLPGRRPGSRSRHHIYVALTWT